MNTSDDSDFWRVVAPYLRRGDRHGDREYLAQILRVWSPEVDPYGHHIAEALHNAIFRGDDTAVRMMLDAGAKLAVQQACDPNFTPLLAASQYGNREMAGLFRRLVGPEGRFFPSRTPHLTCLQVAARNGHTDLVGDFLDIWDGWSTDEKGRALVDAAASWCDDVVAALLARVSFQVDVIQDALRAAVGFKMIFPEDPRKRPRYGTEEHLRQHTLVCRLVDAGGDPNGRDTNWTLLHKASLSENLIGALRALLERGARPNVKDSNSKTALPLSVQ